MTMVEPDRRSKIVNEQEVLRWFEEERTYAWMSQQYLEKYNLVMTPSAWGNFRRRRGLPRRITRDDALIPWLVKEEHRWAYDLTMLRTEARQRAGFELTEDAAKRVESWKEMLEEQGAVVHYDPDTEEGFFLIKREPGDHDLIHEPERKTTLHRNAD